MQVSTSHTTVILNVWQQISAHKINVIPVKTKERCTTQEFITRKSMQHLVWVHCHLSTWITSQKRWISLVSQAKCTECETKAKPSCYSKSRFIICGHWFCEWFCTQRGCILYLVMNSWYTMCQLGSTCTCMQSPLPFCHFLLHHPLFLCVCTQPTHTCTYFPLPHLLVTLTMALWWIP